MGGVTNKVAVYNSAQAAVHEIILLRKEAVMEPLGMIAIGTGIGLVGMGSLCLLISTFRESLLWGLGCLFISPLIFLFLIFHWEDAAPPFFTWMFGVVLLWIGASVLPM